MTSRKLVRSTSLLAALLASAAVFAQSAPTVLPGFELEHLELNPGAEGSLLLGTGRLLDPGQLRVSLLGHYAHGSLAHYSDGRLDGFVVKHRATAVVTAAYAPLRWLEFAAQIPGVVYQSGDDLSARGISSPAKAGLDTPIVSARLGFLSQRAGGPLDLALEVGVGLPFGSAAALGREPGFRYSPRLMLGRELGPIRVGVEVGALLGQAVVLTPTAATIRDEVGRHLTGGVALSTMGEGLRVELNVFGDVSLLHQPNGLEAMLGLRLPLGSGAELFAMGGTGFGLAPGIPRFRALGGFAFGGVRPSTASPVTAVEVAPVVVAPVVRCEPGTPHTPAECPELDDDGDGVKNGVDRCPTEPGPASNQGCPEAPRPTAIKDTDGDGIADAQDKCPNEPGPLETMGCPIKDTDGDGVPDHLDKCPNEPGPADNQGCPKKEVQPAPTTRETLVIKGKVLFDTGKTKIQKRSFGLLNQASKVLKEHPEIPPIHIEGHTDDKEGNPVKRRKLSQDRAEAVRKYLIEQGVDPGRLQAEGYGSERPTDTSKTTKGRKNNRRVEFIISTAKTDKTEAR